MSLVISLADDEWTYLPELQGRRTNLLVGLSLHEGEVVSLAQWTRRDGPVREDRFCLGQGTEGSGMILTMATVAAEAGIS